MTTTVVPEQAEAFWDDALRLLDLAGRIGDRLERAEDGEPVQELLHELVSALPQTPEPLGEADPYLRTALLLAVLHAVVSLEDGDLSGLRIAVERVRQALRDMTDERPIWRAGPKAAAVWLRKTGLPSSELAALLSVSETSLRRWTNAEDGTEPSGEHADRIVVVAKVVNHLRHAMTPRGAVQWLQRAHPALGHKAPIDELKDPDSYRHVVHLASGTRSVVAS